MATDDPKKGAEDKPAAGAKPPRRKPPTLDLSAREVTPVSDDAATSEAAAGDAPQTGKGDPEATTPEAPKSEPDKPEPDRTTPEAPKADEVPVLGVADSAAATDAPAPAAGDGTPPREPPEPVHPVLPPAKPRPARTLGLFGTLLVALLSGVIGAGFALAVVSAFSSAEQNVEAITELEARALDLRQRVEMLEARSGEAPAAGLDAPDELATRLDALESGLDALGKKVDSLPTPPVSAGSGTAPSASPEDVAAVKGQVEALEQRVAALPEPAPAASPADLDATNARVQSLEQKLGAATAAQRESGQGAAQLVVLGTLREAVAAGRPFATELKAARTLLGAEGAPLAALEANAATGFATGPALADRLRAVSAPAPAAETAPETASPAEEGFVAELWQGAKKLVTVRRSEDGAATPGFKTAEMALERGDLDAAKAALAALPEAEREAAQPVLTAIDARQSALSTIAELDRRVLATLAGGAQ